MIYDLCRVTPSYETFSILFISYLLSFLFRGMKRVDLDEDMSCCKKPEVRLLGQGLGRICAPRKRCRYSVCMHGPGPWHTTAITNGVGSC